MLKISKYKNFYLNNTHVQINVPSLHIAPVRSGNRIISLTRREKVLTRETFYRRTELDSHSDTTVAGRNCVPIWNTQRLFDVEKFSDTYEPIKDVSIISADTGFTSTTGIQYMLVFHECLYMPKLSHTLIKPSQLCHFQTQVQDNPYATDPMSIIIPDGNFIACLHRAPIYFSIHGSQHKKTSHL